MAIKVNVKKNLFGNPPNKLNDLKDLYESSEKVDINMTLLREKIKKTRAYYLDKNGLSVDANGESISASSRRFLWGILEGWKTKGNKQLYVWKTLSKDGKFRNMRFGTREAFDTEVAKRLNDNKTK